MNKTQDELAKDPNFKRYNAVVDRALTTFDTIVEWPDYIAFLAKLQKALQSYPSCRVIPSKLVVSSRLAQCLNPSLPSGVHQKTLEVYSFIFSQIGQTGLAEDLKVWLPGLLPLFKYASLSHFLRLFETFIVPLGLSFRPAEKSIILALLSGLEEEHGEYFEQTLSVLDQIRLAVSDEEGFFWQCLWLAIATSSEQRLGGCNYCLKRMGNFLKSEKAENLYASPDPGLFIRSFCAGLTDSNVLVQRGFLELLLKNVPLSLPLLQQSPGDLERLLLSAISVVLRRDMSLNRRLYIWLLGPDEKSDYFPKYSLRPLTNALRKLLLVQGNLQSDPIRVSKISLALLDKWEVGGHVVPELFTPILETVFASSVSGSLSSTRALFDSMDPAVIWAELFSWIEAGRIDMLTWVVDNFDLREEEMLVRHIPQILLCMLCRMRSGRLQGVQWFDLTRKLIHLLPSRAFAITKGVELGDAPLDGKIESFVTSYYHSIRQNLGTNAPLPESIKGTCFHFCLIGLLRASGNDSISAHPRDWAALIKETAFNIPPLEGLDMSAVIQRLNQELIKDGDFKLLSTAVETAIALQQTRHIHKDALTKSFENSTSIPSTFVGLLWRNLAPDRTSHHVEAVSYLWSLTTPLSATIIEDLLAHEIEMSSNSDEDKARSCAKFTVLWKHAVDRSGIAAVLTKPMMLILRYLKGEEGATSRVGVERWLADLGNSAHRMFDIIFSKLLEDKLLRPPIEKEYKDITVLVTPVAPECDDLSTFSYHLDLLLGIFRSGNKNLQSVCADDRVVLDPSRLELLEKNGLTSTDMTYAFLLVRICIRALFVEVDAKEESTVVSQLRLLHIVAIRVLKAVIQFTPAILKSDIRVGYLLLQKLYMTVDDSSQHLQSQIMELLLIIFKTDGNLKSLSPTLQTTPRKQQPLARHRSITGKRNIRENVEDILGPTSLLLHTILDAFSSPRCRPLVSTWSKFFLECLPLFSDAVFPILIPTVECVGREVVEALLSLEEMFQPGNVDGENVLEQSVTLLTLLEGMLFRAHDTLRGEETKVGGAKGLYDGVGFLNNVMSGIRGSEAVQGRSTLANHRLTIMLCIHDIIKLCFNMWTWDERLTTRRTQLEWNQSREYTSAILKDTARRIMQKTHSIERVECFEVLLEIWGTSDIKLTSSVFELLQILNGHKDSHIFSLFVNAINSRVNPSSVDAANRSSLASSLTVSTLFEVFIAFMRQIQLSSIAEINAESLTFLKDCATNVTAFKGMQAIILRLATVYGEKLDDTVIADKRKMRKDFGDIYIRLLTLVLNQSPHVRVSSSEGRRVNLYQNETAAPSDDDVNKPVTPNLPSEEFLSPPPFDRPGSGRDPSEETLSLLSQTILPRLGAILDQEKVLTACTLIVTQIIGPALRKRTLQSIEENLLDMFLELVKVPGSYKAWRRDVYDSFNENIFFSMSPSQGQKWKIIMRTFLTNDKERITEFISRISAATSSILRSSRDQDRLLNVRRLAFIILCGETDQFIAYTTQIKDKITELGRTASIDPIHGEVFLLYRAIMLRFSAVHLITFWPLLVSELQILFNQILDQAGVVTKEQLPLFFEACKVLDMMLVLESEDFQLQEWVFITDTIEAVYRSPNSYTSALIDRLAIRMGSGVTTSGSRNNSFSDDDFYQRAAISSIAQRPDFRPLRQPIIKASSCQNIAELIPFLSHLSVVMYEGSYALSGPADMQACDKQVLEDIFREAS